MAKTNFTRVEDAFEKEKQKQQKEELLKEADRASGQFKEESPQIQIQKRLQLERQILLKSLHKEVKIYNSEIFHKEFGISKKKLELLLKKGEGLTDHDYEKLKKIKNTISQFKNNDLNFDDNLIHEERKKHINKRFNIKDKWLPLK